MKRRGRKREEEEQEDEVDETRVQPKKRVRFSEDTLPSSNSSSSSSSSSSSWSINSLEVDGLQEQIDRGNRRESEKEEEEKRKLEKKPVPDFLQPLYEEKNDLDDTQIDESETKTNTIPKTRFLEKPDEVRLEPFNMKRELDYGKFDEGGHYVERRRFGDAAEQKELDDPWFDGVMEGVDAQGDAYFPNPTSKKGKEEEDTSESGENDMEEDVKEGQKDNKVEINLFRRKIIPYLNSGETVKQALRRFAPPSKMRTNRKQRKDQTQEEKEAEEKEKLERQKKGKIVEELTSYSSEALALGDVKIYDDTLEQIESKVGVTWEYRAFGDETAEIFGPYTYSEMFAWKRQGYFVGEYVMQLRKIYPPLSSVANPVKSDWIQSDEAVF